MLNWIFWLMYGRLQVLSDFKNVPWIYILPCFSTSKKLCNVGSLFYNTDICWNLRTAVATSSVELIGFD